MGGEILFTFMVAASGAAIGHLLFDIITGIRRRIAIRREKKLILKEAKELQAQKQAEEALRQEAAFHGISVEKLRDIKGL